MTENQSPTMPATIASGHTEASTVRTRALSRRAGAVDAGHPRPVAYCQ